MAEDNKRKRSPNWLPSEKCLLVDLVEKHFHIIECKKTDAVSMKKKLGEWDILAAEYNSRTSYSSRTSDTLRAQWDNLKKMAKKEEACNRIHRIQTGGGPANPKKEDPLLARVISLIKTSAVGLFNPFDNDGEVPVSEETGPGFRPQEDPLTVNPDTDAETLTQAMCSVDTNLFILNPIEDKNSGQKTLLDFKNLDTMSVRYEVKDWSDYTPQLLKTPVAPQLRSNGDSEHKEKKPVRSYISRRRPTPSTSTSLEQLHIKKIEAIDLQKELARQEVVKADIIKDLDIKIKQEILKQEKIKTRILLFDLHSKKRQMK